MNSKTRYCALLLLNLIFVCGSVSASYCVHNKTPDEQEYTIRDNTSSVKRCHEMAAESELEVPAENQNLVLDCCESGGCFMASCSISAVSQSFSIDLLVYQIEKAVALSGKIYLQPTQSSLYRPPISF